MSLFWILLGSFGASLFFAKLFHAPKRCILSASLIGMLSYGTYLLVLELAGSEVGGAFAAGLVIAALSELAAKLQHAPAIIFTSIAVIPLVPGGGLYRTMSYMVQSDYNQAVATGVETMMIAGCIALAVALVTAFAHRRQPEKKQNAEGK